ncbi:MAG: chorismate mutase [Clostridia bacterium]|nr:chorismate mutase [Clostridia bacterium]
MTEITKQREEIDRIDAAIIPLLLERFAVVRKIGAAKKEAGLPVFDPAREKAVLEKISAKAGTEEEKKALCAVYESIMTAAKELEK